MSIRSKIFLPIVGSLLIGVVFSVMVSWQSLGDFHEAEAIVERALTAQDFNHEICERFSDAQELISTVSAMTDFVPPEKIKASFEAAAAPLAEAISGIQTVTLSSEMAAVAKRLEQDYAAWLADASIVLGLEPSASVPTPEKMKRYSTTMDGHIRKPAE